MSLEYSIESALPYSENPSDLEKIFEEKFDALVREIPKDRFVRTLLVDDVTSGVTQEDDLTNYTNAATGNSSGIHVMRESMFNELADQVYSDFVQKLPPHKLTKLKSNVGYSSPFYIAVWTLVRLGYLNHPGFPPEYIAEKVINILPTSFQTGEEKSIDIIRMSQFPQAADQVDYIYVKV